MWSNLLESNYEQLCAGSASSTSINAAASTFTSAFQAGSKRRRRKDDSMQGMVDNMERAKAGSDNTYKAYMKSTIHSNNILLVLGEQCSSKTKFIDELFPSKTKNTDIDENEQYKSSNSSSISSSSRKDFILEQCKTAEERSPSYLAYRQCSVKKLKSIVSSSSFSSSLSSSLSSSDLEDDDYFLDVYIINDASLISSMRGVIFGANKGDNGSTLSLGETNVNVNLSIILAIDFSTPWLFPELIAKWQRSINDLFQTTVTTVVDKITSSKTSYVQQNRNTNGDTRKTKNSCSKENDRKCKNSCWKENDRYKMSLVCLNASHMDQYLVFNNEYEKEIKAEYILFYLRYHCLHTFHNAALHFYSFPLDNMPDKKVMSNEMLKYSPSTSTSTDDNVAESSANSRDGKISFYQYILYTIFWKSLQTLSLQHDVDKDHEDLLSSFNVDLNRSSFFIPQNWETEGSFNSSYSTSILYAGNANANENKNDDSKDKDKNKNSNNNESQSLTMADTSDEQQPNRTNYEKRVSNQNQNQNQPIDQEEGKKEEREVGGLKNANIIFNVTDYNEIIPIPHYYRSKQQIQMLVPPLLKKQMEKNKNVNNLVGINNSNRDWILEMEKYLGAETIAAERTLLSIINNRVGANNAKTTAEQQDVEMEMETDQAIQQDQNSCSSNSLNIHEEEKERRGSRTTKNRNSQSQSQSQTVEGNSNSISPVKGGKGSSVGTGTRRKRNQRSPMKLPKTDENDAEQFFQDLLKDN